MADLEKKFRDSTNNDKGKSVSNSSILEAYAKTKKRYKNTLIELSK